MKIQIKKKKKKMVSPCKSIFGFIYINNHYSMLYNNIYKVYTNTYIAYRKVKTFTYTRIVYI